MPASAPQNPASTIARPLLTAEWRSLAMINYEVPPEVLRPLVPAGVELDLWEGRALVSMVGFRFLDTRMFGVPVPFHRHFPEVNLRFYVKRHVKGEWRRGVTFVREIVPRAAIALTARLLYNEPYAAMPMRERVSPTEAVFEWKWRGRWQSLGARVAGDPRPMPAGSEEEFIFEHYWGYTGQRDGSTIEYRVEHPRWEVSEVQEAWLDCDIASLYGPAFASPLMARPASAFVATGSRVAVCWGDRLPGGGELKRD